MDYVNLIYRPLATRAARRALVDEIARGRRRIGAASPAPRWTLF
jgi:hypothetical protein